MARLPRNRAGYPVPWFVALIDGEPDFRVIGPGNVRQAATFQLCWLCGGSLRNAVLGPAATQYAYTIGPMCAVNRVSSEPPAHRDCAIYAATACPFLTTPNMLRRPGLPEGTIAPDGEAIQRNPGVALVWVTRSWRMIPGHQLWNVSDPVETLWFREGRPALRSEALASIDSGMPILRTAAQQDEDPAGSLAELDRQYARAMELLPAARPS